MPATGDPGMLERLERLETKIDRLEIGFDGLEARFDGLETRFDGLATELAAVETRLGDRIDAQGVTPGGRIDAQGRKFDVQMEQLRDDMKKFAEGLGGRLDAIVLELEPASVEWITCATQPPRSWS